MDRNQPEADLCETILVLFEVRSRVQNTRAEFHFPELVDFGHLLLSISYTHLLESFSLRIESSVQTKLLVNVSVFSLIGEMLEHFGSP